MRPRPSERETSSPYDVARRAPTIATASPAGTAASDPATWRTAGGSGSSRSRSGYARSQRQTAVRPASAMPTAGGGSVEALVASGGGWVEGEQILVRQREHARGAAALLPPRDVDRPRDRGDQVRAPEARVTGAAHAAAGWGAASVRCASAAATCSGPTTSEPSRSAAVRATRRTRWWPRALRPSRSWSS